MSDDIIREFIARLSDPVFRDQASRALCRAGFQIESREIRLWRRAKEARKILGQALDRSQAVQRICERWGVSVSTAYRYLKRDQ